MFHPAVTPASEAQKGDYPHYDVSNGTLSGGDILVVGP
jgi:hypothetical protein